jgi:hypothetical protein
MLASNVDWHEGTILKKCWNICEGDPTKFEPHASCMHFGKISSYTNGNEAHKNASIILWRWEVLITRFDIMAQDIRDVFWQFTKDVKECKHTLGNTFWAQLGICHHHVQKKGELLWPTT